MKVDISKGQWSQKENKGKTWTRSQVADFQPHVDQMQRQSDTGGEYNEQGDISEATGRRVCQAVVR